MDETTKTAMESGRPLTIFNIGEVHQLNPNATQVVNHYYGDQFVPKELAAPKAAPAPNEDATRNPQLSKDSILEYVMKLHPSLVRKEWQDKYKALWEEILELPAVADKIYDKGRQQGTTFNRNLVGNILHLMKEMEVLAVSSNATEMSMKLEGTSKHSIRAKLGEMPVKEVKDAVEGLLKS